LGVLFAAAAGVVAFMLYRIESKRDKANADRLAKLEDDQHGRCVSGVEREHVC
jgi:hypothetical protein